MPRKYELKRRAERQEETRQRIVEATVALHTTVGPVRTTVSAIAARAGVQRHTFYRYFPDERSLVMACSGLYAERNPLPDPSAWQSIEDGRARLRQGLGELYAHYERNAEGLEPIVRDAETHALTREAVEMRLRPALNRIQAVLAEPFRLRGRGARRFAGVLDLMMDFSVWRRLRSAVATPAEALDVAVRSLGAQIAEEQAAAGPRLRRSTRRPDRSHPAAGGRDVMTRREA